MADSRDPSSSPRPPDNVGMEFYNSTISTNSFAYDSSYLSNPTQVDQIEISGTAIEDTNINLEFPAAQQACGSGSSRFVMRNEYPTELSLPNLSQISTTYQYEKSITTNNIENTQASILHDKNNNNISGTTNPQPSPSAISKIFRRTQTKLNSTQQSSGNKTVLLIKPTIDTEAEELINDPVRVNEASKNFPFLNIPIKDIRINTNENYSNRILGAIYQQTNR